MRMSAVIDKAIEAKNKLTTALNNFLTFQKAFFVTAISLMALALIFLNKTKSELPHECDDFEIIHGDLTTSLAVVFTGNDTMTPLMMACLYALSNNLAQYARFSIYLDGSNLNLTGIEKERMPEFLVTRSDLQESWEKRAQFYQPLYLDTGFDEKNPSVRFKDTDEWQEKYENEKLEDSEKPEFNPRYTDLCARADDCSTWESSILFFKDARLFTWYVTFRTLAFLDAEIKSKLNTLTNEEIYHLFRLSLKIETALTKAIDAGFGNHEIIPNQREILKRSIIEAFSLAYQLGFHISRHKSQSIEYLFSNCWHANRGGLRTGIHGSFTEFDDTYYMEHICMRSDVLSPAQRAECIYESQNRDLSRHRGDKLYLAVDNTIAQRKPSFFHAPSRVVDGLLNHINYYHSHGHQRSILQEKNGLAVLREKTHEQKTTEPKERIEVPVDLGTYAALSMRLGR